MSGTGSAITGPGTATAEPGRPAIETGRTRVAPHRRPGLGDAIRAEWSKTATMRSTWITLAVAVALGALFGALFGGAGATEYARLTAAERAAFRPVPDFRAFIFVHLIIGYVGLRAFTVEYATRTISVTLAAEPRRGRLLTAKAVVCAGVTLVVGWLSGWAALFAGRAVLTAKDVPVNALGQPGMIRVLAGTGVLLALVSLIGLALGCLVRNTAGALSVLGTMGVLIPAMAPLYPEWPARLVLGYWPITAGLRLLSLDHDPALPGPWAGIAVTCAWAAALLLAAYAVLRRRDA
ncbi:ABC transporter permease [Sphaerisporangium siamense]|uniref:ABC-type transport system involved in multi-copper enzyme maturation permease subunit n=1 Tax=Sphaerisporangium siamense TaxID=795645 RepID=A0A7W7GC86_9ACTN|nr:ABC transporter permease [Sphaerisporangium siamense]MBB4704302.1 ABC-type transport system involved in multi-copper enzyme maturation permease subunit [Sphaerisporangium siamense]GII85017.1 ABC transporter permease [Sphaerisporangium siamense]